MTGWMNKWMNEWNIKKKWKGCFGLDLNRKLKWKKNVEEKIRMIEAMGIAGI